MGVREAIDRAMPDDPVEHGLREAAAQGFRPPGHEIAEHVSHPRGGVVFGEQQMGEVVQGRGPLERRKRPLAMQAFRRDRNRGRFVP